MNRARLFTVLAPVAAAVATFAACSTGDEASPTFGIDLDGSAPPDAAVAADGPTCTVVDIPPGRGKKFCDLPGADVAGLEVPVEFCIREFTTTPVKEARVMRFAPNGDLFVTAPSHATVGGAIEGPGAIVVLPDDDHDGRADAVLTYAGPFAHDGRSCAALEADPKNLACVHGLLFADGFLYFTRSDEVRRFAYAPGDRSAKAAVSELVASLGGASIPDVRWAHTLERTHEGRILVSRGRGDSDECSAEQMTRGAVFSLDVSGAPILPATPELVADGFRNPMYLRCSPSSCHDCYASELSGDNWDFVGGREKLALLEKGATWGYPCCVANELVNANAADSGASCARIGRELVAIPLHDTNFGLDFDRGGFPAPYRHGVFIALHGVFTSFGGTGVVSLAVDPTSLRPTGPAKMFVKGFGPTGRATDVAFAPDGRLFIADDTTGKIYWVAPRTLAAPQ